MSRIVIGHDGSQGADIAVELAGSMAWAPGTEIILATVVPDVRAVRNAWGALIVGTSSDLDAQLLRAGRDVLVAPAARLSDVGLAVEARVLRGRPSEALTEAAREAGADFIIIGSRGLGTIESTLLGSVSQEVVDLAACPVLVARAPRVTRIVLGSDGSPAAAEAEQALVRLSPAAPITVLSVAEVVRPWMTGVAPTMYRAALAAEAADEAEAMRVHEEIARTVAARLQAQGLHPTGEARLGDAAGELLAVADAAGADLIVLGSRGRTGLPRLALGSVARRVVQHATQSVLIAHARRPG